MKPLIPVHDPDQRQRLAPLFHDYHWNYLPQAILEGQTGAAWVDTLNAPEVAVLTLPNLPLHILGGDAGSPAARLYLEGLPLYTALIYASPGWQELVEQVHAGQFERVTRSAFSSERLDPAHLERLAAQVPDRYSLLPLDLNLAQQLAAERSEFSEDHMANFASPEDFIARGFGYCMVKDGVLACVASTFVVCRAGVEIQINTREAQRGQGLASATAARLLLHSIAHGLDPNWDAANLVSGRLAAKLGYILQGKYPMDIIVQPAMASL